MKTQIERAEPSRGAPDAAAERLARFIAQKESLNCKTLDDAVHHQSKWQRIVPEAKEMLDAAYPDGTGHVVLLEALQRLTDVGNKLRHGHSKDVTTAETRAFMDALDRAEAAIQQAERT